MEKQLDPKETKEMKDRTSEIKAKAYAEAMEDISAALGVDLEEIEERKAAIAATEKRNKRMVEVDLGKMDASINGRLYTGKVIVSEPVAEDLIAMVGAKRMRILRENIRHEYVIDQLQSGGIAARLVNKEQL